VLKGRQGDTILILETSKTAVWNRTKKEPKREEMKVKRLRIKEESKRLAHLTTQPIYLSCGLTYLWSLDSACRASTPPLSLPCILSVSSLLSLFSRNTLHPATLLASSLPFPHRSVPSVPLLPPPSRSNMSRLTGGSSVLITHVGDSGDAGLQVLGLAGKLPSCSSHLLPPSMIHVIAI